jgi:hypothetical protein
MISVRFYLASLISACITEPFVGYLFAELEADYDENYNMCICRLIVLSRDLFR